MNGLQRFIAGVRTGGVAAAVTALPLFLSIIHAPPVAAAQAERVVATDSATQDEAAADHAFQSEQWDEAARRFAALARSQPDAPRFALRYALSLHRAGKLEEAIAAHEKAAAFPRVRPVALFNLACAQARLSRPDAAIKSLRAAVEAGFENAKQIESDEDLDSLRSRDDFQRLLREVAAPSPPLTWENLAARLDAEESRGFSGAVLVCREGKVVLSKGYGLADRSRKTRCTAETIFGIGSTPIDFTKAAVLLLAERGKIDLSAPISRYLKDVPADKQAITINHLMTGRSGLQDFLGLPSDPDPDHFWIDRAEAIRRIFAGKLLFEPGSKSQHSHAAWGLLAAIVEITTGESYEDFTRRNLFEPAGMRDTGPFGQPDPNRRTAIAYGMMTDGVENSPPHWGPTSWLVKGSGGMVSTVQDMHRWLVALRAGKILNEKSLARYFAGSGMLVGGDVFGFEIRYTQAPDTYMILITNANERAAAVERLATQLDELVNAAGAPPTPFALGIRFQPHDRGAEIVEVMPGSAAKDAELQVGDIITAINGQPVGEDAAALLAPSLKTGDVLNLDVLRSNQEISLAITPRRRQ